MKHLLIATGISLALSGCFTTQEDYKYMSNRKLCIDYMTSKSFSWNQQIRKKVLFERQEGCGDYIDDVAAIKAQKYQQTLVDAPYKAAEKARVSAALSNLSGELFENSRATYNRPVPQLNQWPTN